MALGDMTIVIIATGSVGEEPPANYACVVPEEDKLRILRYMIAKKEAETTVKH